MMVVPTYLTHRQPCPGCGQLHNDDWPITVNGKVVDGGCQECWERESDREWWKAVVALEVLNA